MWCCIVYIGLKSFVMSSICLYETLFLITPIYSSLKSCTKSCDTTHQFSMDIISERRRKFFQLLVTFSQKLLNGLLQLWQTGVALFIIFRIKMWAVDTYDRSIRPTRILLRSDTKPGIPRRRRSAISFHGEVESKNSDASCCNLARVTLLDRSASSGRRTQQYPCVSGYFWPSKTCFHVWRAFVAPIVMVSGFVNTPNMNKQRLVGIKRLLNQNNQPMVRSPRGSACLESRTAN